MLLPKKDITEEAIKVYEHTLYNPGKVEKRDFGIRCWTRECKLDFEQPKYEIEGNFVLLHTFEVGNNITLMNGHGSLIYPDTQLNREIVVADKPGKYALTSSDETYPLPLNQYEFDVLWDGIELTKQFDADQNEVRFLRVCNQIAQVDLEAAEIYANFKEAERFKNSLKY